MRWRAPANRMSKPAWTNPSRPSRDPTPAFSSMSTMPSSSTPARMRPSTYSRLRRSMMTVSTPAMCSSCPRSNPAGPEPMIATCTRMDLWRSEQGFDFLRRAGRQRPLGEGQGNRPQAEHAIEIERSGRVLRERIEVLAYRAEVASRHHAAERARGAELRDVVRRAVQQRQQRGERVLLRNAELLPQRDRLGDQRHDECPGKIRCRVIERASALWNPQGAGADRAGEPVELADELAGPRDRDRAAAKLERLPGLAEHAQRVKPARPRAVGRRLDEQVEIAGAAAVDARRSGAPANAGCHRFDGVVRHAEEHEIGSVRDLLGRSGPRSPNAACEPAS